MIDPNEAPEGYRAEEPAGDHPCDGCDLRYKPKCLDACCTPNLRRDGHHAILKMRIGPVMATVPLNYGSMGEEVA